MRCYVVTPENCVVDKDVKFVVAPLTDGEYAIAQDHAPVIGRIGAGELRITNLDGSVEHWFIKGGFIEVLNDDISILTNVAIAAYDLNLQQSQKRLEDALAVQAYSDEDINQKEVDVAVARAMLRLAQKANERLA